MVKQTGKRLVRQIIKKLVNPILAGLFLSNIGWGRGFYPPHDFALSVEIKECDIWP